MKKLFYFFLALSVLPSCSSDNGTNSNDPGHRMLLIGNSFFRPYAEHLKTVSMEVGFTEHNATVVTRGGANGWAISFWNDSTIASHQEIKTAFDGGGVEYFGMTSGSSPDNRTEGFREWIQYGLQQNPDMKVFISIPPIDFPSNWTDTAQYFGFSSIESFYDYFVNTIIHKTVVDPLRSEFPNTSIFTIPIGWAAIELVKMREDGQLLDSIDFSGPKASSLFTDTKGHQGQIIIEAGTLMWMNGIYNMDLNSSAYQTGFNTDLHGLADQIMGNHDTLYKQ
jgi:hypothetical protein|tara:strand:- start:69 stop:908 length:840 start_codon:yes stop_codon:yes gene_type:complete